MQDEKGDLSLNSVPFSLIVWKLTSRLRASLKWHKNYRPKYKTYKCNIENMIKFLQLLKYYNI